MKLWHLYYSSHHDGWFYFIPVKNNGYKDSFMYRSINGEKFEKVAGSTMATGDESWPDEEIQTSGKHTKKAIRILFKYGVSE